MPGIVGLITKKPREQAEAELRQMVAVLCHEPFYQSGTWLNEDLGVYAGWAERQGSFSCGMPLVNETGEVTLIFSGEEYPEPGIATSLREGGHQLGLQHASYLVHLCEQNANFPTSLNGRFHGLVVDRRRAFTLLFNDRYGMHRIYYYASKDAFYFAAEAKAILAVCPELRQLDLRSLGEFIACGCVLENRTLFKDLHLLPQAAVWTFSGGPVPKKAHYFLPSEWENQAQLEPDAYYQKLRDTFARSLPRYFNGGERIGLSLTGGLDTRMILAWHRSMPGELPCYSFGGTYRDCADVIIARTVAKACGQPHEVIPVGNDFLSHFSRYAENAVYLTDACVAVNRAADLYVNEIARQIAPVRMTGNYGSEVLRSSVAFKPEMPTAGLFHPELLSHMMTAAETYRQVRSTHPLSFAVFRQAPWHHYGLLALEQTQVSLRSPYLDNDLVRTVFTAPLDSLTNNDVSLRLVADGNTALRKIRTDRGYGGNGNGFYSRVLQEFIEFTVKAEYAYDYGMPQWVARMDRSLSALHLERFFLGRHKFAHFRVWYRDALSDYVRQMLLDSRTLSRPFLNPSAVQAIVNSHLKGDHNFTTEIHQLLTLELLHRLFLDAN